MEREAGKTRVGRVAPKELGVRVRAIIEATRERARERERARHSTRTRKHREQQANNSKRGEEERICSVKTIGAYERPYESVVFRFAPFFLRCAFASSLIRLFARYRTRRSRSLLISCAFARDIRAKRDPRQERERPNKHKRERERTAIHNTSNMATAGGQYFELYRKSTMGVTLTEALDELVQNGSIPPALALKVLQQFDKVLVTDSRSISCGVLLLLSSSPRSLARSLVAQSFSEVLANKVKAKINIKGHLHTFRFCDNVWTFILQNATFKTDTETINTEVVKIVACGQDTHTGK